MKRTLSLLLIFLLLVSMLPVAAFASEADADSTEEMSGSEQMARASYDTESESNNTLSNADSLTNGRIMAGTISGIMDLDNFYFNASSGGKVTLLVLAGSSKLGIMVKDRNEKTVAVDNGCYYYSNGNYAYEMEFTVSAGKHYVILLPRASGSFAYTLKVSFGSGHSHDFYLYSVVDPTCTNEGYTVYKCSCGSSYKTSYVDALGHSWDEGVVTMEPTDLAEGVRTFTCDICGRTKNEDIPKLEHTHSYTDIVTLPTCTEGGYTTHTCACGDSYTDTETAPLGHSYTDTVTPPTCTEGGYTTHTCTCGDTYTDTETGALGHTWDAGTITKEPTAAEDGELLSTCTVCGETATGIAHHYTAVVTEPTCVEKGYTVYTCTNCGVSYEGDITEPTGHTFANGSCLICGEADPAWPIRLAGAHRFETAFLAAVKNAPILLACQVDSINDTVKAYILENMNPGGTVYILGGGNAVSDTFEAGLEGYSVKRLAGDNRFETNLLVLEEAGVGDKPILAATGLNFADSLSASATKLPILLVYGNSLLPNQESFLNQHLSNPRYILGGTGAVSEAIADQLGDPERIAGDNRFITSVLIAEKFFENPTAAVLAYAWNFPDGLCGGSLAASMNAPLILTMENYESQAADYIQGKTIKSGIVLGGEALIPNTSVCTIFDLQ